MTGTYSALDTIWVLFTTILVFFMQAGFMLLETGLTRKKNVANLSLKNVMDFACGGIAFLVFGFGLLYEDGNMLIGRIDLFSQKAGDYISNIPGTAYIAFSLMFCATDATIVSGAVAGRIKFKSYIIYTMLISGLIYPIAGHWVWGNGWLKELSIAGWTGFTDFAGGTVVHMVGGIAALIAAKVLGARIGKYDGKMSKVIAGHSIQSATLGTFILWIGWFGFNAGSTLGIENQEMLVAKILLNTCICAMFAAVASMIFTWIRYNKPDVTLTLSGTLGGLVAITAGCSEVSGISAAVIGMVAGVVTVIGIEFIDTKCHIDDPVGAFAVHGINGAMGSISIGLFATDGGLFITGEYGRLIVQLIGVAAVAVWVSVTCLIAVKVIQKTIGLRVSCEDEIKGLDYSEHGISSDTSEAWMLNEYTESEEIANLELAVPIENYTEEKINPSDIVITKVEILTRIEKFEALKKALGDIGVSGMTVTSVMGCGIQKGTTEFYRGVPSEIHLRPKIQINIVVTKVPVELVVETARKVLYTGHIGDGKIFIYDVKNVIKVRTDERGYDALQGADD